MKLIEKYFPTLSDEQNSRYNRLEALYKDWNSKINVISRKDIDNLYEHHVLHSLAIAKAVSFTDGTSVLDFGTGGGFPGIPLAIMFPNVKFRLIDATGKKIRVATEVAKALVLDNVEAVHERGEDEKGLFDFVVSRAVMPLPKLMAIAKKNISASQRNSKHNGILCLKGGDLTEELRPLKGKAEVTELSTWFDEPWFKEEKKLVYVPVTK